MPPRQPSQSNKRAPHSRTFLRQMVLVQVCILSLAVLVYAWFTSSNYAGGKIKYVQTLMIGTKKLDIKTYSGEKDAATQKITYNEDAPVNTDDGVTFENKLPGDHQYFVTVIQNNDTTAPAQLSLYLDDIYYSPALGNGNWVKIEVTYPAVVDAYLPTLTPDEIEKLTAQAGAEPTADTPHPGLAHLQTVRLTRDILNVPAATQNGDTTTPGEARVYWNVSFSEDIDNRAMGSYVELTQFRIMYNS